MKTSSVPCVLSSVLFLLAGCNVLPTPQADTVRHFTLSGPAVGAPVVDAVQVRPVQLAGHLHGRAMAVRIAEHEVIYLEDVRWAEPLDEAVTQLLRGRLAMVGGGATVHVALERCELVRSEDNSVQLAATYSIAPAAVSGGAVRRGAFTATPRKWDGRDYGALVGLLREAVGEFGDALAAVIERK